MPLNLYPDVYASGSVPQNWIPVRGGTLKYPVRNRAVLRELGACFPAGGERSSSRGIPVKFITLNTPLGGWLGSSSFPKRLQHETELSIA
jgi:hypothetical protein